MIVCKGFMTSPQEIYVKEYLMLREESQNHFKQQHEWSKFSITAVITLLGIALNLKQQTPELYLLPFIVLIIASVKVYNLRKDILRIAGYMIAISQVKTDSFQWERRLNFFRSMYAKKDKMPPIKRLIFFLETQEFTFLAFICLLLFIKSALIDGTYISVLHVIELVLALLSMVFICLVSQDYFSFDSDEIDANVKEWQNVLKR